MMLLPRSRWPAATLVGLALALAAMPAAAQGTNATRACGIVPDADARATCAAIAQTVESAQPQLGIVLAGGNPTLGTASTQGLRLGRGPRVNGTFRLNVAFARLPNVLAERVGEDLQNLNEELGIPAPAVSGVFSVSVYPGFSTAPAVGGIGSIDLLGSVTWLPYKSISVQGFERESPDLAYGIGARVGVLQESFRTPGISLSLMYHRLGSIAFGDVCPDGEASAPIAGTLCPGPGDAGEFDFDLTTWSGRAAISKRFVGLGLTGGLGYDRSASDVDLAFRSRDRSIPADRVVRLSGLDLEQGRWTLFGNASYTFLIATLALEAGWLQGSDPVPGYDPATNGFDPRDGTWYGSAGMRIAF